MLSWTWEKKISDCQLNQRICGKAYCVHRIVNFKDMEDEERARPVNESSDYSSESCSKAWVSRTSSIACPAANKGLHTTFTEQ